MWRSRREIILTENVISHLAKRGNVLDVGCGDGYLSYLLSNRGFEVVGIDFSVFRVRYAHEHSAGADFIIADGRYLPFHGECFDSVVCCEVLEHVLNYRLVIGEMYRVTKKEGRLLVTVPNKMPDARNIHSFDRQQIYNDLRTEGYAIEKVYGFGFELEGILARIPSPLRVLGHKIVYALSKRSSFLFFMGFKS